MIRRLFYKAALLASFVLSPAVASVAWAEDTHEEEPAHEGEAAEGEHAEHGPVTIKSIVSNTEFLAAVLNFVLLLLVLKKLGGASLTEMLANRRKTMEASMAEAAAQKAKAEARYKEYTERLATLDAELAKLRADMERSAEAENKRIAAEAEESAQRMRAETDSLIEQHAQALATQVRREVVQAAMEAAREVILKAITPGDQAQLAEGFRHRIEQLAHGHRSVRPPSAVSARPMAATGSGSTSAQGGES